MANEASNKGGAPDFANMSLAERSEWLLAQLRRVPGTIVVNDEGRWLQLDTTASILPILQGLAPDLTEEQLKSASRWLGEKGYRVSQNMGRGKYAHHIRLEKPEGGPDAATPPANDDKNADPAPAVETDLADSVVVLERAAALITELRERVGQLTRDNAELTTENNRLVDRATQLERRLMLAAPFHDGVEKLRSALDG